MTTPAAGITANSLPIASLPAIRLHDRCVKMEALLRSPSSSLHDGATWMERMAPLISHVRLADLRLPGAHDSGTYGFSNRVLDTWAVTQNCSLRAQLEGGVRYLDLRAGDYSHMPFKLSGIRVGHGIVPGGLFRDLLPQVAAYAHSHRREIIIIKIGSIREAVLRPEQRWQLIHDIRTIWAPYMLDAHDLAVAMGITDDVHGEKMEAIIRDRPDAITSLCTATMAQLWNTGKNLIVCFKEGLTRDLPIGAIPSLFAPSAIPPRTEQSIIPSVVPSLSLSTSTAATLSSIPPAAIAHTESGVRMSAKDDIDAKTNNGSHASHSNDDSDITAARPTISVITSSETKTSDTKQSNSTSSNSSATSPALPRSTSSPSSMHHHAASASSSSSSSHHAHPPPYTNVPANNRKDAPLIPCRPLTVVECRALGIWWQHLLVDDDNWANTTQPEPMLDMVSHAVRHHAQLGQRAYNKFHAAQLIVTPLNGKELKSKSFFTTIRSVESLTYKLQSAGHLTQWWSHHRSYRVNIMLFDFIFGTNATSITSTGGNGGGMFSDPFCDQRSLISSIIDSNRTYHTPPPLPSLRPFFITPSPAATAASSSSSSSSPSSSLSPSSNVLLLSHGNEVVTILRPLPVSPSLLPASDPKTMVPSSSLSLSATTDTSATSSSRAPVATNT